MRGQTQYGMIQTQLQIIPTCKLNRKTDNRNENDGQLTITTMKRTDNSRQPTPTQLLTFPFRLENDQAIGTRGSVLVVTAAQLAREDNVIVAGTLHGHRDRYIPKLVIRCGFSNG